MATIKSIEEKAKRYDEAIKRVEDIVGGKCPKPFVFTEGLFDYIFPELKESEDEKIRKRIISALVEWNEKCSFPGDSDDMIAWLEKKGEQKPQGKTALEAINEEKVDNANKVEPKQEKLTEFEKAVKQVMEEAIECGDTHNLKADAEMLLRVVHKSAWSEEDNERIEQICEDLRCGLINFKAGRTIKGLHFDEIIESNINWLKSLKPQNRWKPSDEQMKWFRDILDYHQFSTKGQKIMQSLYDDLKKLIEE